MPPLNRTNATQLPHDELLLLDALFDVGGWTARLLSQADYPTHMNCRRSHQFGDVELVGVLDDLASRGIIESRFRAEMNAFGYWLTPLGGSLWESERRPDWSRYCSVSSDEASLEVHCLNQELGRAYLQAAQACGLQDTNSEPVLKSLGKSQELVYWKEFDPVWRYTAMSKDLDELPNWSDYEQRRTWWNSINNIIQQPAPPP